MEVPGYIFGCIAPTFTVFNDNGTLDDAGQRRLIDFMLESESISAFFIRSGMGQMYCFSMDDTKQIARNACAHLKGKAAVLIGCSGIWDRNYDKRPDPALYKQQAVELSRYAQDLGADGIVHTIPEGLVPPKGEAMDDFLVRYFEEICASVSAPVLIYQPPGTLPEYCVTPRSIARLAEIDNLAGMKVSTADGEYLFNLVRAVKDKKFGYIAGAETVFYAALAAGARACIGQGTSVNPQIIRAMLDRFLAGDLEGAMDAQEDTNELVYTCPNAVDFFKTYAVEKGYPMSLYARPSGNPYIKDRVPITKEAYETFKRRYEELLAKYV